MTSKLLNPRVLNVADQLLLSATGFGTSVIIVKALGVEQLGVYSANLLFQCLQRSNAAFYQQQTRKNRVYVLSAH
jgi:hypothetical protein